MKAFKDYKYKSLVILSWMVVDLILIIYGIPLNVIFYVSMEIEILINKNLISFMKESSERSWKITSIEYIVLFNCLNYFLLYIFEYPEKLSDTRKNIQMLILDDPASF